MYPSAKPPMNKPLTAAGEVVPVDCERRFRMELMQSSQSTATTVTDVPIHHQRELTGESVIVMTEAVSELSLFEYSMVDL